MNEWEINYCYKGINDEWLEVDMDKIFVKNA